MPQSQNPIPPPSAVDPDEPPTLHCPTCGAEIHPAARRCWHCRTDFPAEGLDESEYRATDGDPAFASTASLLVAFGVSAVVVTVLGLIAWAAGVSLFFF